MKYMSKVNNETTFCINIKRVIYLIKRESSICKISFIYQCTRKENTLLHVRVPVTIHFFDINTSCFQLEDLAPVGILTKVNFDKLLIYIILCYYNYFLQMPFFNLVL